MNKPIEIEDIETGDLIATVAADDTITWVGDKEPWPGAEADVRRAVDEERSRRIADETPGLNLQSFDVI